MNRIDQTFAALRTQRAAALIPFLTAGDPDLDTTRELMRIAADSGADLLELGVPFSDPTADGPVLQHAAEIGLRAGASLPRVLEVVADFRRESELPVILYGYYNPIFHYGPERFAADARRAGVDGVLVVDLPPEEAGELLEWTRPAGVHMIFLLAPTSGPNRMRTVLRCARGFVYYVSVTGVTGVRPVPVESVRPAVERLRRATQLPIGVGFGISTPEQAAAIAEFADAAVVGSAIMRIVDAQRGSANLVGEVGAFIRRLKGAMRPVRVVHAAAPASERVPHGND
ncbi:MAG TPA: tryptophan synthase subunit alpha [Candidatus Margulisiibacteriota bacterium]|nr:tryptophan synthase subunit alpha [Candidatus Margulisiibacteriota bacterium]